MICQDARSNHERVYLKNTPYATNEQTFSLSLAHVFAPTRGIGSFARHMLGKALYPYQEQIDDGLTDSVLRGKGHVFTVMMWRQADK
jgi:hypothetical protein